MWSQDPFAIMLSQYVPELPSAIITLEPSLAEFIHMFYEVSDIQERNQDWLDLFDDKAILKMGPKTGQGKDGSALPIPG